MLDAAEVLPFLHHSLHPHPKAKREVLREGDEEGSKKRKSDQTSSSESQAAFLSN